MNKETIVKVENLCKSYPIEGEQREVKILEKVDLSINSNDFAIIYGPSGSGKSTILHHIVGLEKPTSGSIKVREKDITKMNSEERAIFRAKEFGMVYQIWYWIKSLNAWENVAVPLLLKGYTLKEAKDKAYLSLSQIGMDKYAEKRPTQLSGGEQQKVGLARALINDPGIIIADEPTGNLDTHSADQVMQIFQDLKTKSKRTIIMVTHNLSYLPMANKTIAIKDGKVVSSNIEDVKEQIKQELKKVL